MHSPRIHQSGISSGEDTHQNPLLKKNNITLCDLRERQNIMVASEAKDGREIEEHRTRMKVPNSHDEVTRNCKSNAP